ncbi:metal-dependent hydrolase family protein [Rhodococcus wratislaviensis]|uniref:Peptidase M38 family protein n=1 Tax=Rhodococcus wratislaviensis NBRC 100605 TaxID=1219028 RepID=X0Q7W3_RHOWR|nr:amidohydrolase family protein [Rhodococcus wratislaviensis]GAF47522.1 peptidase M38 family protein [Rhodococcus wratislaviensis NBRC 100605]
MTSPKTNAVNVSLRVDNALIFDGHSAELQDGSILIQNGVIAQVGEVDAPADRAIDAKGGVAIPGLIDAHFHAYGASLDLLELQSSPLSYIALSAAVRLRDTLQRGFTTVRDVAGGDAGLAKALSQGLLPGPRYLFTGAALSQTGGHGDPHPSDSELCAHGGDHLAEIVDGVDALRKVVRERFRSGAHAIKIMASGGVVSPTDPLRNPQYSAEEIAAVTDEARRRGSYVAAHAYSSEAVVHAVTNGVRTIEHGNLIDRPTAEVMREHDAFLVPTLAAYEAMDRRGAELGMAEVSRRKNREVLEWGQRAIEIARDAGVQIGFGTDLMGALEDEQLVGLRLQAEADGILNTLRSATSVNAAIIGRDDVGVIRAGAQGDLVLLAGNPFEDASVLWDRRRPRTVVHAGTTVGDPQT